MDDAEVLQIAEESPEGVDLAQLRRLRHSEQKYRKMIERAADAIFAIDPGDGAVLEANPKAEEMTGYSQTQLRGLKAWELHPPEEHLPARELFERVRSTGNGAYEDANFLRADGSCIAVDVSASVIEYGDQRVIQRICRDVSERRQRQAQLKQHRDFEEMLLDISSRMIRLRAGEIDAAIDDALAKIGIFARVDRAYTYILDTESQGHVHAWGADGVPTYGPGAHSVQLDGFEWALARLRRDEPVIWQTRDCEDDDEQRPCCDADNPPRSSVCVPMLADGRLIGFVGFDALGGQRKWRDDTIHVLQMVGFVLSSAIQRKRAEQALERANRDLELKVQQRTRQLRDKHAQLLQSEKMAALGQLVAGVAHEINTPLGALKSSIQTLVGSIRKAEEIVTAQRCNGERQQNQRLERIFAATHSISSVNERAIAQIDKIVTSLRNFARLDRAAADAVDLHRGIEDALVLVAHELKNRIIVHRRFGELPRVKCHPSQINQVLMNLLVNASQAIEGPGKITIETRTQDDKVLIEISDTGHGIPKERLSQIFDPGFTTKGVGVGTGLGLSIAHQIVEDHGGTIDVRSTVGQGSTFRILLPTRPPPRSESGSWLVTPQPGT